MRWTLTLTAACGGKAQAQAFAAHFEAGFVQLASQQETAPLFETACRSPAGMHWSHIRATGTLAPMDWSALNHFTQALLEHLREAPAYEHCRIAAEIEAHLDEISGEEESYMPYEARVQSDAVWQGLGKPGGYVDFSPGYRWIPMPAMDGTPQQHSEIQHR